MATFSLEQNTDYQNEMTETYTICTFVVYSLDALQIKKQFK